MLGLACIDARNIPEEFYQMILLSSLLLLLPPPPLLLLLYYYLKISSILDEKFIMLEIFIIYMMLKSGNLLSQFVLFLFASNQILKFKNYGKRWNKRS